MRRLYLLLLPLLLLACGHDENGMEPEPTPVDPAPEVNPFDPVEEDGAPMKVMRLKKEDFMKLFVGKEWIISHELEIDKKGNFVNIMYMGGGFYNINAESDSTALFWGENGGGSLDSFIRTYNYDDKSGVLRFSDELNLYVGLINEECLMMYQKDKYPQTSKADFLLYIFQNKDKAAVHQPEPRQSASVFPFKSDGFDKDAFSDNIMSNYLWWPYITLGVYDDGTLALTDTALKGTGLYFGPDGVMREFFKDQKTNVRSVHKCPYTFDKETSMLTFSEGRTPSIFRVFDNKVQVISAFRENNKYAMIGLAVDTNGKSKFSKIVYILNCYELSNALDLDQRAVEVDFDQ